jgi:predicted small lipoprotein YifL
MTSNPRCWFHAAVLLAALAAGAGCGKSGPTLYPVTGKVIGADGKPLEHATVVFHPVGAANADALRPRGKVGADGTFTLTSHTTGDGAPAGDYRVTVELWLAGKGDEPPANRLPVRYAKPDLSGLKATVNAGPTELTPVHRGREALTPTDPTPTT